MSLRQSVSLAPSRTTEIMSNARSKEGSRVGSIQAGSTVCEITKTEQVLHLGGTSQRDALPRSASKFKRIAVNKTGIRYRYRIQMLGLKE
jgi:hypothetical protein